MPDSLDGNEAQNRIIARQLFDAWAAEQDAKTKAERRWFGSNVAGWVSIMVVLVTGIIAFVSTYNLAISADARSQRNETAINLMKTETGDRLARIETKLDLIIGEREGGR